MFAKAAAIENPWALEIAEGESSVAVRTCSTDCIGRHEMGNVLDEMTLGTSTEECVGWEWIKAPHIGWGSSRALNIRWECMPPLDKEIHNLVSDGNLDVSVLQENFEDYDNTVY